MNDIPDPRLVELVSQRMNLRPDEVAALQRGDVKSVLTSRFSGDPRMHALLRMAEEQRSQEDEHVGYTPAQEQKPAESRTNRRKRAAALAKARKRLSRAHREIRELQEELEAAYGVIQQLAHMFGACLYCFGGDEECEECGGDGGPGTAIPVREDLLSWVEPALHRLGLRVITESDRRSQTKKPSRTSSNQQQGEKNESPG